MPKIHLIDIVVIDDVYCKARSSYGIEKTDELLNVTCRVCKGLYDIQTGIADVMPFGGSFDSKGRERANINGSLESRNKSFDWPMMTDFSNFLP